ncbi:UNKNOWN [Stylonychia lemnae]|uniref:Uncharacterized protein n=1 Tax=Stylonychia lemnae TaxID=5949 RepID=A0A078AWV8_STYLE|nr:UNKNOWN [Stylonychia lemnae]|eukprot:CDW86541.1 UNKNOWN [Stylonychia lemnae]
MVELSPRKNTNNLLTDINQTQPLNNNTHSNKQYSNALQQRAQNTIPDDIRNLPPQWFSNEVILQPANQQEIKAYSNPAVKLVNSSVINQSVSLEKGNFLNIQENPEIRYRTGLTLLDSPPQIKQSNAQQNKSSKNCSKGNNTLILGKVASTHANINSIIAGTQIMRRDRKMENLRNESNKRSVLKKQYKNQDIQTQTQSVQTLSTTEQNLLSNPQLINHNDSPSPPKRNLSIKKELSNAHIHNNIKEIAAQHQQKYQQQQFELKAPSDNIIIPPLFQKLIQKLGIKSVENGFEHSPQKKSTKHNNNNLNSTFQSYRNYTRSTQLYFRDYQLNQGQTIFLPEMRNDKNNRQRTRNYLNKTVDGNNSQPIDSKITPNMMNSKEYWRLIQNRAQSNINSQRRSDKTPPKQVTPNRTALQDQSGNKSNAAGYQQISLKEMILNLSQQPKNPPAIKNVYRANPKNFGQINSPTQNFQLFQHLKESSINSGRKSKNPSKIYQRGDARKSLSVSEDEEDEAGMDDVLRHMKHNYN